MLRIGLQKSFGKNTNYSDYFANIEKYKSLKIELKHKVKIEMDDPEKEEKPRIIKKLGRGRHRVRLPSSFPRQVVPHKEFICDRPFMFIIHDQKFTEILFIGIFRGPNQ